MIKKIYLVILAAALSTLLPAQDMLLKNGTVFTFDRGVLAGYDLLVKKGKIARIDRDIPNPGKVKEIDMTGRSVIPGIIDSHNHVGLAGGINETAEFIVPEVDMFYQLNPDDLRIYYSLTGGVTMNHAMHGSANPIGGQNIVIKLKWGKPVEELWEKRAFRTLKMALGENPKKGNEAFPNTRMGVSYAIEKAYLEATRYQKRWADFKAKLKRTKKRDRGKLIPPKKDLRMEALVDTMEGRMVVRCHSYRAEETLDLIRLSKRFGFKVVGFEHIHQAYRIADQLAAEGIGISVFCDSWNYKSEASEFSPMGFEILYEKGVEISINSDTAENMRHLYMDAGKLRRYAGMNDIDALKTITLNPAKMLGVDHFTGSIKVGYDADLAVFDGHPLSASSKCVLTLIEGEIYFDRAADPNVGPWKKGGKK